MSRRPASRAAPHLLATTLAALTVLAAMALMPATSQAAGSHLAYSADGQWRAEIRAGTTNLIFYKSIGAAVKTQHIEWGCTAIFCIDGKRWRWVDREVRSIDIHNVYTPWPPSGSGTCPPDNCVPPAPPQNCRTSNRAALDCSSWGVMFSFDPNPGPGRAQLNAKSVTATGSVTVPDGQRIELGPVEDGFWF